MDLNARVKTEKTGGVDNTKTLGGVAKPKFVPKAPPKKAAPEPAHAPAPEPTRFVSYKRMIRIRKFILLFSFFTIFCVCFHSSVAGRGFGGRGRGGRGWDRGGDGRGYGRGRFGDGPDSGGRGRGRGRWVMPTGQAFFTGNASALTHSKRVAVAVSRGFEPGSGGLGIDSKVQPEQT
jgi:hypothetical protein